MSPLRKQCLRPCRPGTVLRPSPGATPSATAIAALGMLLVMATGASGQTAPVIPPYCLADTDMSADVLATRYAPRFFFGPGEEDFPTLPFFTAFDGKDNDLDGERDLQDLDEIAPTAESGYQPLASWDRLHAAYRHSLSEHPTVPPASAVFYRVRDLSERERREMWRFLRNDEQAWKRFDMSERWPNADQKSAEFRVIEYYFYYLEDSGLEGHREDREFVFVFVPANPVRACEFVIVVGAGHRSRTPNNTLVLFNDDAQELADPNRRMGILVELGGHASAPSWDPEDVFEVGIDVNWHSADVWGTRDLMAITGTGFAGNYRPEMTFSRQSPPAVRLDPYHSMDNPDGYRLLPVEPFDSLSRSLEREGGDDDALRWAERIYCDHLERCSRHGGTDSLPSFRDLVPESRQGLVLDRMRAWTRNLRSDGDGELAASHHEIWEHRHYKLSPVIIFKEHLYRPSGRSVMGFWDAFRLLTWGLGGFPGEAYEVHGGFVFPALNLPVRLPGFVELQAGIITPELDFKERSLALSVVWDADYREHVGWYGRLGYVPRRAEITGDVDDADVTVSGGLSLLIWSSDRRSTAAFAKLVHVVRIRTGPRVDVVGWDRIFDRTDWEFLISFRQ